jgi:hypothetical protein
MLLLCALQWLAGSAWAGNPLTPVERGGLVEIGVGVQGGWLAQFSAMGRIFAGYKLRRVHFGLGIDLSGGSRRTGDYSSAPIAVVANPGVRVTLVRSADLRLELFGQLDLGVGYTYGDTGPGQAQAFGLPPGTSFYDQVHFIPALGPGLRYWLHPHFAVSLLVLFRADLAWWQAPAAPTGSVSWFRADFGLLGLLQAIAVF